MITFQPKWSEVPLHYRADYETYLKVKALKRWYWMTVQDAANWRRWARKTVYRQGPEPKFCEVFGHQKKAGYQLHDYYWRSHTMHKEVLNQWLSLVRYPSVEPVEALSKGTVEQINHMYDQVATWFANNRRGQRAVDPVMKHRALVAHRNGEYQTTKQIIDELKAEVEEQKIA